MVYLHTTRGCAGSALGALLDSVFGSGQLRVGVVFRLKSDKALVPAWRGRVDAGVCSTRPLLAFSFYFSYQYKFSSPRPEMMRVRTYECGERVEWVAVARARRWYESHRAHH